MKRCEICPKQAYFNCSKCQKSYYCSKDHQIEHWKHKHKYRCLQLTKPKQNIEILIKKRFMTRKQYYENYSNKVFDLCVLDSKAMVQFQKNIKNQTKDTMDEYEYGACVCLLVRSYILVNDKKTAKLTLENYLIENKRFIQNLDDIPDLNNFTQAQKQLIQRKMNLLSTIANLNFLLEMDCIKYYVIYTKNIQIIFGKDSFQASNCYFLIGCYFAEEGQLKKAIACFQKAKKNRSNLAGDCYFNIAVLYNFQSKHIRALQMFQEALQHRQKQYGEDRDQIAQVYQNTGQIYVELNDFITAMIQYEKAFKIRSSTPYSAEYRNLIELIHELYDKLCIFMSVSHQGIKKPSIFQHLKLKIEQDQILWREKKQKKQMLKRDSIDQSSFSRSKIKQTTHNKKSDNQNTQNKDNNKKNMRNLISSTDSLKDTGLLIINQNLLTSLNQVQLYMLSELQLELTACKSLYSSIYSIGRSLFIKKLSPTNFELFKQSNPKLFELIRQQNLVVK